MEALQQAFYPQDVEIISSLLLSLRNSDDSLLWHFTSRGKFSVSSAYMVEMEWRRRVKEREGNNSNNSSRYFGGTMGKLTPLKKLRSLARGLARISCQLGPISSKGNPNRLFLSRCTEKPETGFTHFRNAKVLKNCGIQWVFL